MDDARAMTTSWIRVRVAESMIAALAVTGYAGRYTLTDWVCVASAAGVHIAVSVAMFRRLRAAQRAATRLRKWQVVTALLATMLVLLATIIAGPLISQLHALSAS